MDHALWTVMVGGGRAPNRKDRGCLVMIHLANDRHEAALQALGNWRTCSERKNRAAER